MNVLLFLACAATEPVPYDVAVSHSERLDLETEDVQNVVLIQADALALSHLANYGYGRDTAPGLEDWWTMDGLSSVSSWTGPSVASMMSGLEPRHHQVLYSDNGDLNSSLEAPSLALAFRDQGYATVLISGNHWVQPDTGLGAGFDRSYATAKNYPESDLANQRQQLSSWLDGQDPNKPFFAMLHAMDTHSSYFATPEVAGTWATDVPFDPSAGYPAQEHEIQDAYANSAPGLVEAVNNVYDEEILGVDLEISRLQADLAARGLLDNTLLVLTTDHGEFLGENGRFGHGATVEAPLVHIPLMMYNPRLPPSHQKCVAENVDTLPTVMAAVGLDVPAGLDGKALQEGCRTWSGSAQYESHGVTFTTVDDGNYKLTLDCATGRTAVESRDGTVPMAPVKQELYSHLRSYTHGILEAVPTDCQVPNGMLEG